MLLMRGRGDEANVAGHLIRLGIGVFFAMFIMLLSLVIYSGSIPAEEPSLRHYVDVILLVLATPVVVLLGGPFFLGTWSGLRHGRMTSDALVVTAVLVGYLYSAFQVYIGSSRVYFDTLTMVLLLFTLGRYLEALGRARANGDLEEALDLGRQMAHVVEDGKTRNIPASEIDSGWLISVLAGERIPVDGTIISGTGDIDEAMLTGESVPVDKQPGDMVQAGSINGMDTLLIRCARPLAASRWAALGSLVRQSLARRSPLEDVADRIVGWFLPTVLLVAASAVCYWFYDGDPTRALSSCLAVLVVACPCALGLAVPLASSMGVAAALRHGVVIHRDALGRLPSIRAVAFDKTGTLTRGHPTLSRVVAFPGFSSDAVMDIAVTLAVVSEHVLSRAIATSSMPQGDAVNVRTYPGFGIGGEINRRHCSIGSRRFMEQQKIETPAGGYHRGTEIWVAAGNSIAGKIMLHDAPRPEIPDVIACLKAKKIYPVILSGDNPEAVSEIARQVGIEKYFAEMRPEDKLRELCILKTKYKHIAMVGDGINDAPVLAAAEIGIAVADASGLAKVSSQIMLPHDGLGQLPYLFELASKVRRVSVDNLRWAFFYNVIAITLAAGGLLQPVYAASLMAGSSLMVLLNSQRLRRDAGYPLNQAARDAGYRTGWSEDHAG
ncbi:MAG: heavy metal translocating P-type ATPase [Gammaproteobacteria bacterium]